MGTSLSNFTDFVKATGPAYLTGPESFINEAVNQTWTLPYMLKGKGMDKVLQSGDRIFDDIMFDDASTALEYNPNEEFNWTMPQVVTEHQIDWRFTMDHMAWTEHAIILNGGDMSGKTRSAQAQTYLRLRKKIEQRMWTSLINKKEAQCWANPVTANMEAQTGKSPYSIPAFITEDTTNYHAASWTTIQGIDPASQSKWRNQVETYDYDDPDDTDGDSDGLIDAFDAMWTDVAFMPPGIHNEHFEGAYSSDRQVIFCSKGGFNQYKRLLRASNDELVKKTDAAYNNITFSGITVARIASMDALSIAWDPSTSGTAATETGASANPDGYRYYWVNGNYMTPVFHTSKYFEKKDPYHLPKQPWSWVCPVDCWGNIFCQSRQRQGIVAPQ